MVSIGVSTSVLLLKLEEPLPQKQYLSFGVIVRSERAKEALALFLVTNGAGFGFGPFLQSNLTAPEHLFTPHVSSRRNFIIKSGVLPSEVL